MIACRDCTSRVRRWLCLLALSLVVFGGLTAPYTATAQAQTHVAGLVIRHGDGSVSYYIVRFSEPQITGTQLLERAGVQVSITPYAGMGEAVCRIDGEGCPSSNCFCKSYANPSVYWHYYDLNGHGTWTLLPYGPDQRTVRDGDVDGWSWSSTIGDLPPTTLAQIARINGVSLAVTPVATPGHASPTPVVLSRVTPVATSTQTVAPVLGVKVETSGQTIPVKSSTATARTQHSSYVWFGAGVAVLLAVGLIVVIRERRREP